MWVRIAVSLMTMTMAQQGSQGDHAFAVRVYNAVDCQAGVFHRSSCSSAWQIDTCNDRVVVTQSQSFLGEGTRPEGTPRKGLQGPELTPPPSPSMHHTPPCHKGCPLHQEKFAVSSRHMPFSSCRATRPEQDLMRCCLTAHLFSS